MDECNVLEFYSGVKLIIVGYGDKFDFKVLCKKIVVIGVLGVYGV